LDVAQLCECDSEWGATLGVVKACSNFRFSRGGDHVLDDGSAIKDGTIQLILFRGLLPQKNRPPRRLRAFENERYEASLWMYSVMSEA
jgi:hypothetical protein